MKRVVIVLFLAVGTVLGVVVHTHRASAWGSTRVRVTLKDYRVMVAQRDLPAGKSVTFVITNRGHHMHEFVLEPANAFDRAIRFAGKTEEADEIKPGTTRTVIWTIPSAGTYKLACHIDHHYQKGMRTLIEARHASN